MSLKHGLLGLLNYGPMTGYELDKAFKESLNFFWQAQTSQIYRELGQMERNGWLTSERVIQDEKPNKRVYSITPSGKKELESWLMSPEADTGNTTRVRSSFLMRVFFAGELSDEQALSNLRAFREECMEFRAGLEAVSGTIDRYEAEVSNEKRTKYWEITAMFGEIYIRAVLEWVEKAIHMLGGEK